jgi:hypothetical protein
MFVVMGFIRVNIDTCRWQCSAQDDDAQMPLLVYLSDCVFILYLRDRVGNPKP